MPNTIKEEPVDDSNQPPDASIVDSNRPPNASIAASSEIITDNNGTGTSENVETAPVDITDKIDVAEKIDLFKSVFLSSSESEDEKEDESTQDKEKFEAFKSSVLSEPLIPKIKPMKQGILSDISSHIFTKPASEPSSHDPKVEDKSMNPQLSLEKETSTKNLNLSKQEFEENGKEKIEVSRSNDASKDDKIREENIRKERHKKKKKEKHKKKGKSEECSDSDEERVKKHKKRKHKRKKEKHKHDNRIKKKSKY